MFSLVFSLSKPKKISSLVSSLLFALLVYFVSMSSSTPFVMSPEAEVLTFKQRDGEKFKNAWERISSSHKKIQPMLASNILFRCFYLGPFGWYKHALDLVVEGNFLECEDTRALNAINGLVNLLMENNDKNAIHDKLDKILNMMGKLNLNEIERPLQEG